MRLTRIELAGFKSFVDPTKIDLDRGITAIVGPNGCGKSNIVDALRWVLGEHSAKHLRGGVMDDLIFQGSDSRSPVAVCDVELTFAIERGSLATPYHELDEIRVRRRLTRDGGSDAFINGKMVRLKDVVDLFLDTGISTRAYAIVEQGSIARMVTAKPEERRVVFEEAAGVMKYRSRRREAERRMKDTRQNLDRVLDLLEEVRGQCRSLKQQASRAGRFRNMQEEFAGLQSLSLGLRYQQLQKDFQEVGQNLAAIRADEAEGDLLLASAEKFVVQARESIVRHEDEVQSIQGLQREAERRRSDLQQQAERMAGERRLLAERRLALGGRVEELRQHKQRIEGELAVVEQRLADQDDAELQALRLEAARSLESAHAFHQQQGGRRDILLSEFERLRLRGEQGRLQKEKSESALARLRERAGRLDSQLREIQSQLAGDSAELEQSKKACRQGEQVFDQAVSELAVAQKNLDACRLARESRASILNEKDAEFRELTGTVRELRGRTKNQDVSDELRENLRCRGAVWVDEVLSVPDGLEAAVAAALRGRLADAHMPANPDLAGWKEALSSTVDVPVALFVGQAATESACGESLAEAIGVSGDHPLYDLFAPISLVDDITQGLTISGCSVSRDGWRFESDGWLVPPSGNRTARRLVTQRKLREGESLLLQFEVERARVVESFKQAELELESCQVAWQRAHLAVTEAEGEWRTSESAVARLQAESSSLHERQQHLISDKQELEEEKQHWQQQFDQSGTVDQCELQAVQQRLAEQDVQVSRAEQTLNQTRTTLAQADQSLALFAQAKDNLIRESGRLKQESLRLKKQTDADFQRLQQVELEFASAEAQGELDQDLIKAAEDVEIVHNSMNDLRQTGHTLQQAQHEAERAERQERKRLQTISEKRQSIALREAQNATRLQDLASEIDHRCQLPIDALLEGIEQMEEVDDINVIMNKAAELEERLSRFGPVNLLAIEEFEQASEREIFLSEQATDLEASLATLSDTIARIDRTTRQRFLEVFDQTNALFQQTFPQLFGGGRAELRLDSDDILTAGVEVIAQPPGKRLQDVTLLSGGEKALTAVALVFSIFKIKPAPFCVLDEVDAPLDDANVARFGEMVRELSDRVQFLSISHNRITMQQADRLIGVSMPEPGVSKIVAVDMGPASS